MIDRRNIKRIYLKTARKVKDFLLSDKSMLRDKTGMIVFSAMPIEKAA